MRILTWWTALAAGCVGVPISSAQTWYFTARGEFTDASVDPFPAATALPDWQIEWGLTFPGSGAELNPDGLGILEGELGTSDPPVLGGVLRHNNFPIETWWEPGDVGPGMIGPVAFLDVDYTVDLWLGDPSKSGAPDAAVVFAHDSADDTDGIKFYETLNDGFPPDGPGQIGEGHVFVSNMDDLFEVDSVSTSETVWVDGSRYTVTLSGFYSDDPGGNVTVPSTHYWSSEQGVSHAYFGLDVQVVPEPTTWSLNLLGLAGLGWARPRKASSTTK